MTGPTGERGPHTIAWEAYGAEGTVTAGSPELLARIDAILPPGWKLRPAREEDKAFSLREEGPGRYSVFYEAQPLGGEVELELALELLEAQLRAHVAAMAPDYIFVHAGVVSHRGRAVLAPGPSFAGKTTLVRELVRAGAEYYSDEYAVLDDKGLVHPYGEPESIRDTAGDEPLRVGLVAITEYRPGAEWDPRPRTQGEGVLALLANTVPAHLRPEQALATVTRALDDATILESHRGEASDTAEALLRSLAAAT
jgi:hypothetical protein